MRPCKVASSQGSGLRRSICGNAWRKARKSSTCFCARSFRGKRGVFSGRLSAMERSSSDSAAAKRRGGFHRLRSGRRSRGCPKSHKQAGHRQAAAGLWRNGSASDSRSEGWAFESLWPHFLSILAVRQARFEGAVRPQKRFWGLRGAEIHWRGKREEQRAASGVKGWREREGERESMPWQAA